MDTVFYRYHHATKHTLQKLMASTHTLDWANQPDPFRRYDGTELIYLPRELSVSEMSLSTAIGALETPETPAAAGDLGFISHLLYYSMAISAWKEIVGTNHRWSLRVDPSSGNLHPTDTHLLLNGIEGIADGAYHYYVPKHALEKRAEGAVAAAVWGLVSDSPTPATIVCLTSVFWREAWKYQQRAYRYCQHDLGHCLAAIRLSAAILGWHAEVVVEFADEEVIAALGLKGGDENPMIFIGLRREPCPKGSFPSEPKMVNVAYKGEPNALSDTRVPYPIIDEVHAATLLTREQCISSRLCGRAARAPAQACVAQAATSVLQDSAGAQATRLLTTTQSHKPAHVVIRQRRSAVDLDGRQRMSLADLAAILIDSTPKSTEITGENLVDLYLYIHRIDGLDPGIYSWDRTQKAVIPLVLADERAAAKYVSCFQDIAADGCLALSMVADLKRAYELYSDRGYRYVHYEAGFIGQLLYLTSLSVGYESTGIGCFLDDDINRLLGLDTGKEVIYNFTIGRAVNDPRLTTRPSYDFDDPTNPGGAGFQPANR